jgi:hypothetical protein
VNATTTRIGYGLIGLAMVVFALSALFLHFYRGLASLSDSGITYYDLLTRQGGQFTHVAITIGGTLTAFGGPALIAALSLLGFMGRRGIPVRSGVTSAVAVWCMLIVGSALIVWGSRESIPLGPGYWVQAACAGGAIVGVLLLFTPKAPASPTEGDPE